MLAGYDMHKGPALYLVTSDGQRLSGRLFSLGSGSLNAYGTFNRQVST